MSTSPEPPHQPSGLFARVDKPAQFAREVTADSLLQDGRNIIDSVDPKIAGFMANFSLSAEPIEEVEIPERAQEKLDGAPKDLLIALLKYVHFNGMSEEMREKNIVTLAGFVAQRFTAISLIAHGKKMNGEESPVHPQRHTKVLHERAAKIAEYAGNSEIGYKAFLDFMDAGCFFQKAYMTGGNAEASAKVEGRLKKIEITPL